MPYCHQIIIKKNEDEGIEMSQSNMDLPESKIVISLDQIDWLIKVLKELKKS